MRPVVSDNIEHQCASSGIFAPGARFTSSGDRRMAVASCKDGSERPVSVQCNQFDAADALPQIASTVDLCKQAQERADDLNSAELARVSERGEVAAALAHEINQPLTAILGNAQAAQRFLKSSSIDPSDLRAALTDIVADSLRATEIVRKLRQLMRGATAETRLLDMATLVREVTHLMRRNAMVRGASVTLDIAKHVPMVRGDNTQLQQVIINLLQNAFDALEGCSAGHRVVSVKIGDAPQGGGVSIAVSDRGPGLKADQIGEVFKPFSTSKLHGLGLGLAISSSIVSMHGGRLWAENSQQGGATFHIVLPPAGDAETSGPR